MTKYIHLMPHPSTIYNRQIIDMINKNPAYFNKDDHVFIIANEDAYSDVKEYANTKLDNRILNDHHTIERYARQASYVFLHENQTIDFKAMLHLSKQTLHKFIWCVWGHDLYYEPQHGGILQTIKNTLKKILRTHIINNFHAIGIGFKYDSIAAHSKYQKPKIVYTPYGYVKGQKDEIDKIANCIPTCQYTRVMIGHSAYPFLNHKPILDRLQKYKDENIKISLVLAYGDMDYAKGVKEYAYKLFDKEKIEIIDEMLTHQKYLEYLQSVDICIFDFEHQAALGNFYILCYMNKKLFLNKNGILKHAADAEKIKSYAIEDLDLMDFNQFKQKPSNNQAERDFGLYYIDDKNYLKVWKDTLDSLT